MFSQLELRIPPPVLALVTALVMWAGASHATPKHRPSWLHGAMLGILVTGAIVMAGGIVALRAARTTVAPTRPDTSTHLVRSGIYRLTRNPIYLGVLLILTAWAMHLWQPQSFVALPVFAGWLHRFQILPEERALRARFGADFDAYVAGTSRWL
jgi:protein-S-isoprenylcysteine O-methyltransferase Ste14